MAYLASSSTAAGEIAQLHHSKETYTIRFDRKADGMRYDRRTRTVIANPTSGLRVKSSGAIQSPALGTGHEISHAAEHDRIGTKAMAERVVPPQTATVGADGGITVTVGTSVEEARATGIESQMAEELGEAKRNNYHDESGDVRTCGPTSTTQC